MKHLFFEVLEKWEHVCEGAIEHGKHDCAFCVHFHNYNCEECPISEYTGHIKCRKTPYVDWNNNAAAKVDFSEKSIIVKKIDSGLVIHDKLSKQIAEQELEFLNCLFEKWLNDNENRKTH